MLKKIILLTIAVLTTVHCAKKPALVNGLDPQVENAANYFAVDAHPESADAMRKQLGSFFLVEHFTIEVKPSMKQAIQSHQPGGILFWNGNNADALQVRKVISAYAQASAQAKNPNLLFSADYEGGDLQLTTKGKMVVGIQRFKKGFTKLAHPAWLGQGSPAWRDQMCYLHGKIIAKEMASVGLNFPLSVVSDLAKRLFANRGISTDPKIGAACLKKIMAAFAEQKNVIFMTKHFPGLASTNGDTHEGVAKSDAKGDEPKKHLFPFESTVEFVNENKIQPHFSIMAGHGLYPEYDKNNLTTVSPTILGDLLRGKLNFQGVVVSDAMWMGGYGELSTQKLMPVYLQSFLAGMDMLMIPGSRFADAITYFRAVYDNELSDSQKATAEKIIGDNWAQIHQNFLARIQESLARINSSRAIAHNKPSATGVMPVDETTEERSAYYQGLLSVSSMWAGKVSVPMAHH